MWEAGGGVNTGIGSDSDIQCGSSALVHIDEHLNAVHKLLMLFPKLFLPTMEKSVRV